MKFYRLLLPRPARIGLLAILLTLASICLSVAELQLPTLKSGTVVYSNVTVYSQTETDLYISHAQGLGNVKISTLDDDSLRALGLKEEKTDPQAVMAKGVTQTVDRLKASLGTNNVAALTEFSGRLGELQQVKVSPQILGAVIGGVVLFYLLFCVCLKMICQNAGSPASALIWFPILQMFPLLRAAKMSPWTFLLFLIPIVNIGAQIWWCFAIAKACGKGVLTGILLILPITGFFAFLYLAFSRTPTEAETEAANKPVRLDGWASA